MGEVISLAWGDILSIGGLLALVMGVAANYFRVTTMTMVNKHIEERLKNYTTSRELDLQFKNMALKVETACKSSMKSGD